MSRLRFKRGVQTHHLMTCHSCQRKVPVPPKVVGVIRCQFCGAVDRVRRG